jgi:serine/threonine protein kinase
MLKKFSGDSHPHLVSLLSTYEQFKKFYLVFHWAEADLQVYWKEINPAPSVDRKTILWMAQQCRGIADGLSKIHHYETSNSKLHPNSAWNVDGSQLFGRHGDIKPANVLWFRDPSEVNIGNLKITDFGLAEFSAPHTKSYKPKSKVATTLNYRPPECDLEGGVIGRSYDIWTLGCLYLEFITWLLGGWKLVHEFAIKRASIDRMFADIETDTFFEIVKGCETETVGAMIKPIVTDVSYTLPKLVPEYSLLSSFSFSLSSIHIRYVLNIFTTFLI